MVKLYKIAIAASSTALLPVIAFAQGADLRSVLGVFSDLINGVIPLLLALAVLAFFWGLVKVLFAGKDEGRKEGISIMVFGIIAIFVMVSLWGIIRVLRQTFKVDSQTPIVTKEIRGTIRGKVF